METIIMPCIDHQYLKDDNNNATIEVRPNHLHRVRIHTIDTGVQKIHVREAVCIDDPSKE